MYPFLNEIQLNRHSPVPIYIQLANEFVGLIKQGILKPGYKLPGSRVLAKELQVHRQTIVATLEELSLEGWLISRPQIGTFVNEYLPETKVQKFSNSLHFKYAQQTGFELNPKTHLSEPIFLDNRLKFDDGFPDIRLAPTEALARTYASVLRNKKNQAIFTYGSSKGDIQLREAYTHLLNQQRGLKIHVDNVFIIRGSIMGIYLLSELLIQPRDIVVVGDISYRTANICFKNAGANLLRIKVDEQGLDTQELAELCQNHSIRVVYVTSHHHHPTSVTLSPDRRMHLLELARMHRFAIIEDDYDFDFHYQHRPVLPLASADQEGLVLYIGSLSKILSPAIRVGFLVAPQNLIQELSKFRRLIDRQGDMILERTIAQLLNDGTIRRSTKKSLKAYRERRDFFCQKLKEEFSDVIDFQIPEGGLAVWARFSPNHILSEIATRCQAQHLYLSDGSFYNPPHQNLNASRMGFASMNQAEMQEALAILKNCL